MSLLYVVICHNMLMICFRYFLLKESPIHGWFWCSSSRGSHLGLILHSFRCCFDLIQVASRETEDPTVFFPNSRWLWHASIFEAFQGQGRFIQKDMGPHGFVFCQGAQILAKGQGCNGLTTWEWLQILRVAGLAGFGPNNAANHPSKCQVKFSVCKLCD